MGNPGNKFFFGFFRGFFWKNHHILGFFEIFIRKVKTYILMLDMFGNFFGNHMDDFELFGAFCDTFQNFPKNIHERVTMVVGL